MLSSVTQFFLGSANRKSSDRNVDEEIRFNEEVRAYKERFDEEKRVDEQARAYAKLAMARKYKAEEKAKAQINAEQALQVQALVTKYLPIDAKYYPLILKTAEDYSKKGYDLTCPINVILLHSQQAILDYKAIDNKLEAVAQNLGSIEFQRWCNKDVAHNSMILNLHAAMANIPTLVISPLINGEKGKIGFTVSMWEAQTDQMPFIRPLFSLDCDTLRLRNKDTEYKEHIQNQITNVSTVIAGCARDTYMLLTQGLPPTLCGYLEAHEEVARWLLLPENEEVVQFVLGEYNACAQQLSGDKFPKGLLKREEVAMLAEMAEEACEELNTIFCKKLTD